MLSVLIATHNGADTIDRTLAAMSELSPPPGGWKLVVVNNASTDDTESRILKWRDRLPLEYLVEPRLGKAVAMNTALEHAAGDFIVMTDDDVIPDRNWLLEWRRVADEHTQLSVFGGKIVPLFESKMPAWALSAANYTVLYAQTPEYAEGEIEPINVSGPNMSIRRNIIDEGWRFGERFMIGSRGLMGEDSEFVRRLARAGHRVGFAPTASVQHIINVQQTSLIWIMRRFLRHGRTMFMLNDVRPDPVSNLPSFKFPRWRIRRMIASTAGLLSAGVRRNRARVFSLMTAIAYDMGAILEALSLYWR